MPFRAPRVLPCALVASVLLAVGACSGGSDSVEPPPTPGSLVAVAGAAAQTAAVAGVVPEAPAVRVLSTDGEPMAGVGVRFAVMAGGGSVASTNAQTNADGIASAGAWTLGTEAGANEVTATIGSLPPVRFSATATAGPVTELQIISGDGQTGAPSTPLPEPLWVRAVDAYGNPVEGVSVEWVVHTGGGSVQRPVTITDGSGATPAIWTLGQNTGEQQLLVRVEATGVSRLVTATAELTPLIAAAVDVTSWNFARFQCALRESGAIGCWGQNRSGLLGDGTTGASALPVPLAAPGVTFRALAVGGYHACALTAGGAAYCWGDNTYGAIGDGTQMTRLSPVPVSGGHVFTELHSGVTYACGLKAEGTLWCWGTLNSDRFVTPTQVSLGDGPLTAIALGRTDLCAISPSTGTWCVIEFVDPMLLQRAGAGAFVALAAGNDFTCGLDPTGAARCWGRNQEGQLGDGTSTVYSGSPVAVVGGLQFASLSAGGRHACGVTPGGDIYCWGSNEIAQLGTGEVGPARVPSPQRVAAPSGVTFRAVSAGYDATCAVATTGDVFCWGVQVAAITDDMIIYSGSPAPARVADR